MSELDILSQYCTRYKSGIIDGYVMGVLTILLLWIFIEVATHIIDDYNSEETRKKSEDNKKAD
jgi:hypothetical protein